MKKISSGLLLYRQSTKGIEVFLVHPGGPYFRDKDNGYWSIPKGLVDKEENFLEAAYRELQEETGISIQGEPISLGSVERSDKIIYAFALEYKEKNLPKIHSNLFQIEWPPNSGKLASFPEVDKGEFFPIDKAYEKIQEAQRPFLDRLKEFLGSR
jgi:predicted NUDIX family NTP pyrophosphohydrolase